MTPIILAFSGTIGSGKSTLSEAIAQELGWNRVSFGDYVRQVAKERNLPLERNVLQELGSELISEGVEDFCKHVLAFGNWQPGQPLILDGIRHTEIIPVLKRLVYPLKLYLIYIDTDKKTRLNRVKSRDSVSYAQITKMNQHPTEKQVQGRLPQLANLRLDGTLDSSTLVSQVVHWIKSNTLSKIK